MRLCIVYLFILFLNAAGCKGQTRVNNDTSHHVIHKSLTDSAHIFARNKDTSKAIKFHKRALYVARKQKMHEHEARSLMHIAGLLKQQDARQSFAYLTKALNIAERLGRKDLKADIMLALAGIYRQQQNYSEALSAIEEHQRLLQHVFDHNKQQEIQRIKADDDRQRERAILLTIVLSLITIAGLFAFYYRRTKRLNSALHQSNQIKDKLFSIIGHDLRGPAGGIMQALEMVDAGLLDEQEEKEVISLLKQQSRSFNETLNSLLNWAAAQIKGTEPHIASLDTIQVINKTLDLLMTQASNKNINIISPADSGLKILADSDQFDFIIRNLVSNAIKFSFPGGRIAISARQQDNNAVIAVQDSGKGIPTDKQAKLFADGQLDSTFGTGGEKGTGLGLMLSWDFIKANRGRIWFESTEGAGTTFYVSLPLA